MEKQAAGANTVDYSELVEFLSVKFDAIDKRFEGIDKRFDALEKQISDLPTKTFVLNAISNATAPLRVQQSVTEIKASRLAEMLHKNGGITPAQFKELEGDGAKS